MFGQHVQCHLALIHTPALPHTRGQLFTSPSPAVAFALALGVGCWRFIPITNLNSIYALKTRGVRHAACFIASPGELVGQVGGLCSWVAG